MLKHVFYALANNCGGIGNGIGNSENSSNLSVMPEPEYITPAIDIKCMSYTI